MDEYAQYLRFSKMSINKTLSRMIVNILAPVDVEYTTARDRVIGQLFFHCTCASHPEQYDVYHGGVRVANVRLRHGRLYASTHAADVYDVDDNEYPSLGDGSFETDAQRKFHLNEIAAILTKQLQP